MFTTPQSQRKGWAGWAFSPKSGATSAAGKGKQVADGPPPPSPPPPQGLLGENSGGVINAEAEVWRGFKEAGFLDESSLQKREKDALSRRIAELERELHEYQYNMGLLLIEKKEWTSKFEELKCSLAESEELLKREQSANLIAVSELEKREESARQALGIEKQCVMDLEKALREMRTEVAAEKFKSEKRLADALVLETRLEEKYVEAQAKVHAADAKLAEANRKSSEVDRKIEEAEERERKLERERLSLVSERKAQENGLSQQRAYLQEWEKKLQEGQKRLLEGQSSLNEREQRVDELKRELKEKERELNELQEKVQASISSYKDQEENMQTRLRALIIKEQEAEVARKNLEKKENDLLELEEKLNKKEKVELQELLDNHNAALNSRRQEVESELEERKRLFDEEMKSKLSEIEKVKVELQRKEEVVLKREAAIADKMEKLIAIETDVDRKLKSVEDRVLFVNEEEEKLLAEKQKISEEYDTLMKSKDELQNIKAAIEVKEQKLIEEVNSVRVAQQEREQFELMQSQLKREIEDYRLMKESLQRQIEDLRQERERFEREWDVLDEKRRIVDVDTKLLNDEKEKLEKWRRSEEERLQNEMQVAILKMETDLEDLRLKQEAFENLKAHELLQVRELLEKERADMSREYDLLKHELEINMQKRLEETERKHQQKEDEFERRRDIEINKIEALINSHDIKSQKLRAEEERIMREKTELNLSKNKLEADRLEIQKDIETLATLNQNLKEQREEFIKERDRFLAMADNCKLCGSCGAAIELQPILRRIEDTGNNLLPTISDSVFNEHRRGKTTDKSPPLPGSRSGPSDGRISWLRNCTRLFNFSPRKVEYGSEVPGERSERLDKADSESDQGLEVEASLGVTSNTVDSEMAPSYHGLEENEHSQMHEKAGDVPEQSVGIADNSILIEVQPAEQNERGDSSILEQPQAAKEGRRHPNRKTKGVKRTRSVKAVVEDAKAILGETVGAMEDTQPNGDAKGSLNKPDKSLGDSIDVGQPVTSARQRKRSAHVSVIPSEHETEDSETHSESVSQGGRRKRRHLNAPGAEAPVEKRYNLRRPRIAGKVSAAQAISNQPRGQKKGSNLQPSEPMEINNHIGEETSKHAYADRHSQQAEAGRPQNLVQLEREVRTKSTVEIVVQSVEISERGEEDGEEVGRALRETTPATPSGRDSSGEDGDDYEEEDQQNTSLRKKIWTFLTT